MQGKKIRLLVVTHKDYKMPADLIYQPICVGPHKDSIKKDNFVRDDDGINIADRNNQYSELTALYWGWKNLDCDYMGIVHYRRYMANKRCKSLNDVLSESEIINAMTEADALVVKPRHYLETVEMHYINCHKTQHEVCAKQIAILNDTIKELQPNYYECYRKVMSGHSAHMFNMFIMKKEDMDSYCEWLFPILFETEKRIREAGAMHERLMGSLSEFLLDVWLNVNDKKIKDMGLYQTEMDFFKRVKRFLYRRFFENEYK